MMQSVKQSGKQRERQVALSERLEKIEARLAALEPIESDHEPDPKEEKENTGDTNE